MKKKKINFQNEKDEEERLTCIKMQKSASCNMKEHEFSDVCFVLLLAAESRMLKCVHKNH